MTEPTLKKAVSKLTRIGRFKSAYLLDLATAPFVRPDETIIISGFWRSGTTWLQETFAELLRAKMVFEPFRFQVDGMQAHYQRLGLAWGESFQRAFMPYGKDTSSQELMQRIITAGLRSTLQSDQVRMYRDKAGLGYSMRRRVILKSVRLHLAMDWFQETFPNPIVHIYRDPRAVIASAIYKTYRMWGVFEPFDLAGQLLDVKDGRAGYFASWEKEIRQLSTKNFQIQLAAYWVFTERYMLDSLQSSAGKVVFVRYEDLVRSPEERMAELLDHLAVPLDKISKQTKYLGDSPSTTKHGQNLDGRIYGWRKLLPEDETKIIEGLARKYGLGERLVD